MKFFNSIDAALAYVSNEFLATLQDDLQRMESSERRHYTDEDRDEMRDRIEDLTSIQTLIEQAESLRVAAEQAVAARERRLPILVVIRDGVVKSANIAEDGEHLEQLFQEEASKYGVNYTNDESNAGMDLDNGYVELGKGASICMTWAEHASSDKVSSKETTPEAQDLI